MGALSAREDGDEDAAEETEETGDTLVVPVPGRGPGREGGREVSMASMATGCSSMARALAVEEEPVSINQSIKPQGHGDMRGEAHGICPTHMFAEGTCWKPAMDWPKLGT